jgi:hypothetical protein
MTMSQHETSPSELLNARVRFWQCPVPEHKDRRGVVTVEWRDDVAHCTADGCTYTSVNSLPAKALADVAALRAEIGEYGTHRIIANVTVRNKKVDERSECDLRAIERRIHARLDRIETALRVVETRLDGGSK